MSVERLQQEATQWATLLYALRDGQSGLIEKVEWGPSKKVRMGEKNNQVVRTGRLVMAEVFPVEKALEELPPEIRTRNWVVFRPTLPDVQAWEQLKQARSIKEIRQVARRVCKWERKLNAAVWRELPKAIRSSGPEILEAKKLPNYPRSNRPRSDDKRILFFAKILAGLALGIAPTTATKRLVHWSWPKDWVEKGSRDFIEGIKAQKGENR